MGPHPMIRCGLLIASLMPQSVSAQAHTDSTAVAVTIRQLEEQWAADLISQDSTRLQVLLAPEFALVVSANPQHPFFRPDWFATLRHYVTHALTISGLTVRVFGDVAVASFIADLHATVRGADRSGKLFITDVWRRSDVGWRVVARYSSTPEAESASTRAMQPDSARPPH